jgi:hypothetical protein
MISPEGWDERIVNFASLSFFQVFGETFGKQLLPFKRPLKNVVAKWRFAAILAPGAKNDRKSTGFPTSPATPNGALSNPIQESLL